MSGARRSQLAFRDIARVSRRGAFLLSLDPPSLGCGERFISRLGPGLCLVTRLDLVTAIAKGAQLLRELRALLLGARKLSASRFQRRFGDTALRSHCRLPGEKLGERGLGFTRRRFRRAELGSDACSAVFAVLELALDGRALLLQLGNRASGIALQRLLARDVAGERSVQPLELRQTP